MRSVFSGYLTRGRPARMGSSWAGGAGTDETARRQQRAEASDPFHCVPTRDLLIANAS